MGTDPVDGLLDLSVVAPAHNEEETVEALVGEIERALAGLGLAYEIVIVDDGSTDRTRDLVLALMPARPWLRCVAMTATPPGRGHGQSAAFAAGLRASRGRLVAMLDADLQNDPADIPRLLELLRSSGADVVQGDRSAGRRDGSVRRAGSVVGRLFRRWILGDRVRDTGCSLRVMKREVAERLPLEFRGMHRFIPVSAGQMGYRVVEAAVNHRVRGGGVTKYGAGVGRAFPGLIDCFAVRWMHARRRPTSSEEVRP